MSATLTQSKQVARLSRKEMNIIDRFNRFFSPDAIHRQLHPAPAVEFSIRKYCPKDQDAVMAIYELNAPGRFPEGHRPTFEKYLRECDGMLFVAESRKHGIIACGGVLATGPQTHTLCYGLVSPEFQGKRIGSTLALARLVFATRAEGLNFSFIYAVDKSLSFYQQFGYQEFHKWKAEDQTEYPVAILQYQSAMMTAIEGVLSKRGHAIEKSNPLARDPNMECIVKEVAGGQFGIVTRPISGPGTP